MKIYLIRYREIGIEDEQSLTEYQYFLTPSLDELLIFIKLNYPTFAVESATYVGELFDTVGAKNEL